MSKIIEIETEYGNIEINENVIIDAITDAASMFDGRLYLSKSGGKLIQHGSNAEGSAVSIQIDGDEIEVEVYVILKFGISIKRTIGRFIDEIDRAVSLLVGKPPRDVSVIIKGVLSRRLAKREIVIRRDGEDESGR